MTRFGALVLAVLAGNQAFGATVDVQEQPFVAEPGDIITIPVAVVNDDDRPRTLDVTAQLPEGWRVVADPPPVELSAQESAFQLFIIQLPATARAGRYDFTVEVPGDTATADVTVDVATVDAVTSTLTSTHPFTLRTGTIEFTHSVRNEGSSTITVIPSYTSRVDLDVDDTPFSLQPGETRDLSILGDAPGHNTSDVRVRAVLKTPDGTLLDSIVGTTDIVDEGSIRFDGRNGIPASVGLWGVFTRQQGETAIGPQVELDLSGKLDASSDARADIRIRAPGLGNVSARSRAAYDVRVSAGPVLLNAGDRAPRLNLLLRPRIRSRGASLRLSHKGAYIEPMVFGQAAVGQVPLSYGGTAGYSPNKSVDIGTTIGSFVNRGTRTTAVTTHAMFNQPGGAPLSGQVALGWSPGALAAAARTTLSTRAINVTGAATVAQRAFPGAAQIPNVASLNARLRLSEGAQARLGHSLVARAIQGGWFHRPHAGLQVRLAEASLVGADWSGRFATLANVRSSHRAQVFYALRTPDFSLRTSVFAQFPTDQLLANDNLFMQGAGLTASWRPSRTSVIGTHAAAQLFPRSPAADRLVWATNLTYRHRHRTLSFGTMYGITAGRSKTRHRGRLDADWTLPIGHHLLADVTLRTLVDNRPADMYVGLGYRIPLSVPTTRVAPYAVVEGSIRDTDDQPIPGAMVAIGGRAVVTTEDGTFAIPGLRSGTYDVVVDETSLPERAVVLGGSLRNLNVQVDPDEHRTVVPLDLTVAGGARLRAECAVFGIQMSADGQQEAVPTGPCPGTINGTNRDTGATLLLLDGQVANGVAPGSWRFSYTGEVQGDRSVQPPSIELDLQAGADETLTFELRPTIERIEFVPLEDLVVEAPPVDARLVRISARPTNVVLGRRDSTRIRVRGHTASGLVTADIPDLAYTSQDPSIATVDADGVIRGLRQGRTAVSVTAADVPSIEVPVDVSEIPLAGLFISDQSLTLALGQSFQLTSRGIDTNGQRTDVTERARWVSSDPEVVSVDTGLVTGVAQGTAEVFAEVDIIRTYRVPVTVIDPSIAALALDIPSTRFAIGDRIPVAAHTQTLDGTKRALNEGVTFDSSNPQAAQIIDGELLALSEGTAEITATWGGESTNPFQVRIEENPPYKLVIQSELVTLPPGVAMSPPVEITWRDGERSWAGRPELVSDNPAVVMAMQGMLLGVGPGQTTIRARVGDVESPPLTVSVVAAAITGLSVQATNVRVPLGQAIPVSVFAALNDGTEIDVTTSIEWQSDNTAVQVNVDGTLEGAHVGQATLTGTFGGASVELSATVAD